MKNTVTNAADISILSPIEYNTYKTGGGPVSVGATVVQSSRGAPNKILAVRQSNWQAVLGKPYPKKVGGVKMEGLRHINDALANCDYVNVVRVMASNAMFPSISFGLNGGGEMPAAITTSTHTFGTQLTAVDGIAMIVWVIDGDASANRKVLIKTVDDDAKRFTIEFSDVDENGNDYILESYKVGLSPTDIDDMGLPAFIETVLETNSDRFRCDFNGDEFDWESFSDGFHQGWTGSQTFVGGTDGGDPEGGEWEAAWDLFRNESVAADIMFAAGNVLTNVLANCLAIADLRHCSFIFDAPPGLDHEAAITWLGEAGLESRQAACYHAPFAASDEFYGGKTVWGVSGEMAAAYARCDANYTGEVPGVHYAPAGEKRAKLKRTGILQLFPDDIINRDDLYTARINPIIVSKNGGAVCDDSLALYTKENYSRFIWVVRIGNYIDHRIEQAATTAKFEPDGITRSTLTRLATEIMEDLVTSGALVPPRDPSYGSQPYIITVDQLQIDLWQVTYEYCPTGAARRIVGQPKLIK